MAMIKCPDCKTQISDSASACPRCGCDFQPAYRRMLRLRSEVYSMERQGRPAVSSINYGLLILGLGAACMAFLGFYLFGRGELPHTPIGLVMMLIGGFVAYVAFGLFAGSIDKNRTSNASAVSYDQNHQSIIAQKKRELAAMEAKFR